MTSKNTIPTFFTTNSFIQWRSNIQQSIGFVPTMGNLHHGHRLLVEEAFKKYSVVVVSIFVNPTQFGPNEDFDKYPRTLEHDCLLLLELWQKYPESQLVIYAPKSPSEIYVDNSTTLINPGPLANVLEGKSRPGHFQGVCNVVAILLHLVEPQGIFLGKKDYQQLKLLSKMIHDLKFKVTVYPIATVRNSNGLALSSRNSFLSSEQLSLAEKFPICLNQLKTMLIDHWHLENCWNLHQVESLISTFCKKSLLAWDYCELRQQDLAPLQDQSLQVVLLGVIKIEQVRLLDNLEINL